MDNSKEKIWVKALLNEDLHTRLKISSATDRLSIQDKIIQLLKKGLESEQIERERSKAS